MKKLFIILLFLLSVTTSQLQAQTWTQVDRIDFTSMAAGLDYSTGGTAYYDDAGNPGPWNGFINTDAGKYLAYLTGNPRAGQSITGDVFCKTYTGLIVGRTYRYSYKSMNMSTLANALLAVKLDGIVVTTPASPATNFGTFSRTPFYQFTATSTSHTICITNSQNTNAGNDFGINEILLEIVTLPISGTVFNDSNGQTGGVNGTPMSGVTVTLYAADGTTVIATATTDASGNYTFPAQPPGTYQVVVTPPTAYSNVSSTDATPTDGRTTVTLAGATPATGVNFGIALDAGCSNNPVTETYSSFTGTSANSSATISGTAITGAVTVSNIMDGSSGFGAQNFTFGPSSFNGIRTAYNSTVTHTFSQPVKDPILVLASLGGNSGNRDVIRIVQFNDSFTVLNQYDNFTAGQGASVSTLNINLGAKTIAGSEDGVIIRFSGVFTSISYTSFAVLEDMVPGFQNGNQAPVYSTSSTRFTGEDYLIAWQLQCYLANCYKPAITSGTILDTQHGISSLGRAGVGNSNWPMVRKGAWTALEAKTKGFVPNRLTTAQKNALVPVEGMMVYDTNLDCLSIYNGTAWNCFNTQACPN